MPTIDYFPYMGPNRRCDKTVVEITLIFTAEELSGLPLQIAEIRQLLIDGGVLSAEDIFPEQVLSQDYPVAFTSLLAQTALLFQQKTGHRVEYHSVVAVDGDTIDGDRQFRALVEHEHCDVGMTAVKLACELLLGQRKLLSEPFRLFSQFAAERVLPPETEAIINAARRRDIPSIKLERLPYVRKDFEHITGGKCRCPNGLLMLGHGQRQFVLDGTYCFEKAEDFRNLPQSTMHSDHSRPDAAFLDNYADQLLDWLFPPQAPNRMPIIAVTGTNGKTTTSRMINHMMAVSGRKPGLVCTDGIYLNGQQMVEEDKSSRTGHLRVLCSRQVDVAVLETHHRSMAIYGFAFNWCDIAVCLNVTEDHLGVLGIDTTAQMAVLKRSLLERARYAAVLNVDDPLCVEMLESISASKVALVSMLSDVEALRLLVAKRRACFCVLEEIDEQEWLVIYDQNMRLPLILSADIPATFGATARFNVSNAMHASIASYLSGTDLNIIKRALGSFGSDYDSTPGRLNVFDELPFRIIMDFAHNPDGVSKLCEFVDKQKVSGRKLIAFSGPPDRTDETLTRIGASVAGHFDFYFCKEYVAVDGSKRRNIAHLLQNGLIEAGVDQQNTVVKGKGKKVIFEILDSCEKGDLLLMLMGHYGIHHLPGEIKEYVELQKQARAAPDK